MPQAPVKNIRPTTAPLEIALPDGKTIQSTHTCELDIPSLPPKAREAHIVPGLKHASLISIKMLCDAGCNVEYNANKCDVIFRDKKCGSVRGINPPDCGYYHSHRQKYR